MLLSIVGVIRGLTRERVFYYSYSLFSTLMINKKEKAKVKSKLLKNTINFGLNI